MIRKKLLPIIVSAIIVSIGLTGCLFINTDDYIKITQNEEGNSIINYDGNIYKEYVQSGTGYTIFPNTRDTEIGRTRITRFGYESKYDVFMLDGSNDNIIVTYRAFYDSAIWIKEGHTLPDIFDAEIGQIYYRKPEESIKNLTYVSAVNDKKTLKDFIDKENYTTSINEIETKGKLHFHLAGIDSLAIVMGVSVVNSDVCLKYLYEGVNYTENYFYCVNDDLKELIIDILQS